MVLIITALKLSRNFIFNKILKHILWNISLEWPGKILKSPCMQVSFE